MCASSYHFMCELVHLWALYNGLLQIFGATQDDIQSLKIVSIQEVDIDVLDSMIGIPDDQ